MLAAEAPRLVAGELVLGLLRTSASRTTAEVPHEPLSRRSGAQFEQRNELMAKISMSTRVSGSYQKRTGIAAINRKSGVCPVIPNCAVRFNSVRFQRSVLKPTSTLLNSLSELGTELSTTRSWE
jgi:hypothetical protein